MKNGDHNLTNDERCRGSSATKQVSDWVRRLHTEADLHINEKRLSWNMVHIEQFFCRVAAICCTVLPPRISSSAFRVTSRRCFLLG